MLPGEFIGPAKEERTNRYLDPEEAQVQSCISSDPSPLDQVGQALLET